MSLVAFTTAQASILSESRSSHDANTRKLKACESDFIRQGLARFTCSDEGKRKQAESVLVYYWNLEVSEDREASVRALFSQIAKSEFEEAFNGSGVKVEDDKLVIAKQRKVKKSPLQKMAEQCLKMHKSGKFTEEQQAAMVKLFAESLKSSGL